MPGGGHLDCLLVGLLSYCHPYHTCPHFFQGDHWQFAVTYFPCLLHGPLQKCPVCLSQMSCSVLFVSLVRMWVDVVLYQTAGTQYSV